MSVPRKSLPQAEAAIPLQALFVHMPTYFGRQSPQGLVTAQALHVPPKCWLNCWNCMS